jgi:hypothetical protein
VRNYLRGLRRRYFEDQLGGAVTSAQNAARVQAMDDAPPERIYASEILDTNTCKPCRVIDGREYSNLAAALRDYPTGGFRACQGRHRCRGTLVAVYR